MLSYLLEGLTAQSIFERMISLKKKTLKMIASTVMLAFGMTVVPLPALAVSSNIVAETKDKNTLTISQIQDLAVIYNDNAKKLQTSMKQLELQEQMTRNNRRDVENTISSLGSASAGSSEDSAGLEHLKQLKTRLQKQLAGLEETDPNYASIATQIALLEMQIKSAEAAQNSAMSSLDSTFDSLVSNIDTINDALDQLSNSKDDLNKSMKDLETQMRYMATAYSLQVIQLENSISLLEDSIALNQKLMQLSELQKKLGMNIDTDVATQQATLKEAENSLEDMKENLSVAKRQVNILIGRNAGNPLEIVPMNLPVAIDPAPAYTEKLIKQFTDNNYTLKTLERDKADLKEDGKNSNGKLGSDELKKIDYNIESKEQEIKDQEQKISNDLKALLAQINKDGEAYKVSRQKYVTEKKNFEYTQKKYELGMISEITLRTAEMKLKQAEMTNIQNGYAYYLDWQRYYANEKGVSI